MTDYVEAPKVTLNNDDPSLIDKSVRTLIETENDKAISIFSQITAASEEREQTQLYSDTIWWSIEPPTSQHALRMGYPESPLDQLSEGATEAFPVCANPFYWVLPQAGEHVVDLGSGGPDGQLHRRDRVR